MQRFFQPIIKSDAAEDSKPCSSSSPMLQILSPLLLESVLPKLTKLPPRIPLTESGSSWVIHIPKCFPPPSRRIFQEMFDTHPDEYHPLFLFGKQTFENRYSQLFTTPTTTTDENQESFYRYSGTAKKCIACNPNQPDQQFVMDLCQVADALLDKLAEQDSATTNNGSTDDNNKNNTYNCCLVNWYKPQHSIGLHSDDEMEMNLAVPIMSLSWGGPRRFLLRPKPKTIGALSKVHEIVLKDGDWLIMGGRCQEEFKHEVPRLRKTMDGLVGDRISWTIRCMKHRRRKNTTASSSPNGVATNKRKRKD